MGYGHGRSFAFFAALALLVACSDEQPDDKHAAPTGLDTFPVGEPMGQEVRAMIGPEGGMLSSSDASLTLTVPPGAVDEPTAFAIQEISRTAPHGDAPAFRLSPHGHPFATPVTLTFALRDRDLRPSAHALVAAYQDQDGAWQVPQGVEVDAQAKTLTVSTDHFSDWTYAESLRLTPSETKVRVGESVDLVVESCLFEEHGAGEHTLIALVRSCRPFSLHGLVKEASVNAVVGGNASVGRISSSAGRLTYVAPATIPSANPVAVSASIDLLGRRSKLLVVSHVEVVDDKGAFVGQATSDAEGFTLEAHVTWTPSEDHAGVVSYVPRGMVTAAVPDCTLEPATAAISPEDGQIEVDFTYDPPRYYGGGTTHWMATLSCADAAPVAYYAGGAWLSVTEPQSANPDATLLEGTSLFWSWSFEREQ